MRAAGIPARVVAGYQGGELSQGGDVWEVRQKMRMHGLKFGSKAKAGYASIPRRLWRLSGLSRV